MKGSQLFLFVAFRARPKAPPQRTVAHGHAARGDGRSSDRGSPGDAGKETSRVNSTSENWNLHSENHRNIWIHMDSMAIVMRGKAMGKPNRSGIRSDKKWQ